MISSRQSIDFVVSSAEGGESQSKDFLRNDEWLTDWIMWKDPTTGDVLWERAMATAAWRVSLERVVDFFWQTLQDGEPPVSKVFDYVHRVECS